MIGKYRYSSYDLQDVMIVTCIKYQQIVVKNFQ